MHFRLESSESTNAIRVKCNEQCNIVFEQYCMYVNCKEIICVVFTSTGKTACNRPRTEYTGVTVITINMHVAGW